MASNDEVMRKRGIISGEPCFCQNCQMDDEDHDVSKDYGDRIFDEEADDEEVPECLLVDGRLQHKICRDHLLQLCNVLVTLEVGAERQVMTCNRALLTCFSGFFSSTFYGPFQEATSLRVTLHDDKPYVVKTFIDWVSSGVIDESSLSKNTLADEPLLHEELWVFGDKVRAPEFCNLVLEFLVHKWRIGKLRVASARYIYCDNTTPTSNLRGLLVNAMFFWSPLLKKYRRNTDKEIRSEWRSLIAEGGNFAVDLVTRTTSFLHSGQDLSQFSLDEFEEKKLSADGHGTSMVDFTSWRAGQQL